MHRSFAMMFVALFVLASAAAVKAQDLSEFDKKVPLSEMKTECLVQDFSIGDKEERKLFEATRSYDIDGWLKGKSVKVGDVSSEFVYTHKLDTNGRVAQWTGQETMALGDAPPHIRPMLVWDYVYTDSGSAIVCKEVAEDKKEDDPDAVKELPIVQTWHLDSAGRMLVYSMKLGEVENLKVVFSRDENGKLLSRAESFMGEEYSKETFTYGDSGTLKESERVVPVNGIRIKKQYGLSGRECSGQMVDGAGKTTSQWIVHQSIRGTLKDGSTQDETMYTICGEDKDKVEMTVRYLVTTTINK